MHQTLYVDRRYERGNSCCAAMIKQEYRGVLVVAFCLMFTALCGGEIHRKAEYRAALCRIPSISSRRRGDIEGGDLSRLVYELEAEVASV
jgi:hypothetical protein